MLTHGGSVDSVQPREACDDCGAGLVGLLGRSKSRTRGSGADEGVRPTSWLRLCCYVGQPATLA
jgi:hypothetical protein